MELKSKNVSEKTGKSTVSIVLYAAASVVALIGIGSLVNSILLYRSTVAQYVAQGYPADVVSKQLLPTQLLPGIFEAVAVYGGIAIALFGIGVIGKKVSKCLMQLNKPEVCNEMVGESIVQQDVADVENAEESQQTEPEEEIK